MTRPLLSVARLRCERGELESLGTWNTSFSRVYIGVHSSKHVNSSLPAILYRLNCANVVTFLISDFIIMELEVRKNARACCILRKAYWVRGRAMFCVSCAWVARGRGTLLGAGLGASSSTTRIKVAGAPPTRGSNTPPDRIPHLSSRYTSSRAFKPLYSEEFNPTFTFQ